MEGDNIYYTPSQNRSISIHSLRMEGDEVKTVGYIATNISIHSLRMEGDRSKVSVLLPVMPFQSTPSVWRETENSVDETGRQHISIHSLRMEGDI